MEPILCKMADVTQTMVDICKKLLTNIALSKLVELFTKAVDLDLSTITVCRWFVVFKVSRELLISVQPVQRYRMLQVSKLSANKLINLKNDEIESVLDSRRFLRFFPNAVCFSAISSKKFYQVKYVLRTRLFEQE